jgi:hypothetical protein
MAIGEPQTRAKSQQRQRKGSNADQALDAAHEDEYQQDHDH